MDYTQEQAIKMHRTLKEMYSALVDLDATNSRSLNLIQRLWLIGLKAHLEELEQFKLDGHNNQDKIDKW